MYKIGSGTHSAPLAHNKKIKSTALDIRQPAAVQQSISYLTILALLQRYTYRVLQTIHMKLILLCVWAERAVLGSAKTALRLNMRFR